MRKILILLPLLFFYVLVCVFVADNEVASDEARYAMYARNLAEGFYAPPDTLFLWNGPGYPLMLVPFVAAKVPLIWAKYFNCLLLFGAASFLCYSLCEYMSSKKAAAAAYVFGFYVPMLWEMTRLLSESLAIFLVAGFCFFTIKYFRRKKSGYWLGAVFFLAWLILTKVIFAYIVSFLLVMAIIFYKFSPAARRAALLYLASLLLCLPYLVYTYSLTGKVFYWANSGGSSLYWMTTPYANEYGDWKGSEKVLSDERLSRHKQLYEKLEGLDYVERDRILKKQAIANVRRHPLKYCFNWAANLGRMWYAYPYSYKYQRPHTLFYMVPNSILLVSLLFCVYPVIRCRNMLPAELVALIIFVIIFLGASSLAYACERYIKPVVPIFIMLISFTITNLLEVRLRKKPQ